jgi:hypothetical protein
VLPIVKRDGERLIGPDFVFQQVGATSHTSKKTVEVLKSQAIDFIEPARWPPNSPDLNPLDYFYWNEVSKRCQGRSMNTRENIIKNIKNAISEIPLTMVQDSIDLFRLRMREVEKKQGGLIHNIHA